MEGSVLALRVEELPKDPVQVFPEKLGLISLLTLLLLLDSQAVWSAAFPRSWNADHHHLVSGLREALSPLGIHSPLKPTQK